MTLARRETAEFLGTPLLLAAVVGSGIVGQRLSDGNVAIALLAKHDGDGRYTARHHSHIRPGLWRSLQSRRHARGCLAGWARMA